MNRYCFIVTSTLYSHKTCYSVEERFNQTMNTLCSIREKDPDSYILLIDNSHIELPEEYLRSLEQNSDKFVRYEHNLASLYYNLTANKSLGELMLMHRALEEMERMGIEFDRVFKLSGRYLLNENFHIREYDTAPSLIIGALNNWGIHDKGEETSRPSFETALWSFPFEQFNNVKNSLLVGAYDFILKKNHQINETNKTNLENAFFNCIPKDVMYIKNPIGVTTNWSEYGDVFHY